LTVSCTHPASAASLASLLVESAGVESPASLASELAESVVAESAVESAGAESWLWESSCVEESVGVVVGEELLLHPGAAASVITHVKPSALPSIVTRMVVISRR
jgi:hypothetical protein